MSDRKYSFRNEIKLINQKEKEEKALKDFKRNQLGLILSAIVFFFVLLMTINGIRISGNLSMLLIVVSLMGVFYFGRELKVLPKGQLLFSAVKALLCIGMDVVYISMHQGLWDITDYGIIIILAGVVLVDIPRVINALKKLKA